MKRSWMLILFCVTWIGSSPANGQDYSGTWTGVVTKSSSGCRNIVKAAPGEYSLTFTQNGNKLKIMQNAARRLYEGALDGADAGLVKVRGTYPDSGGFISEEVLVRFTGPDSGEGQSTWRWTDAWHQCGGWFTFTLRRNR